MGRYEETWEGVGRCGEITSWRRRCHSLSSAESADLIWKSLCPVWISSTCEMWRGAGRHGEIQGEPRVPRLGLEGLLRVRARDWAEGSG